LLQLLANEVIAPAEKLIEKRQQRLKFLEEPELVTRRRRRTSPPRMHPAMSRVDGEVRDDAWPSYATSWRRPQPFWRARAIRV